MQEESLVLPVASSQKPRHKRGNRLLVAAIIVVSLASFAALGLLAASVLTLDDRPLQTVAQRDAVVAVATADAKPRNVDAQIGAVMASIAVEDSEQALLYANRAVTLDPKSPTAKLAKAQALRASGDLRQARTLLEEIRKTESQSTALYARASLVIAVIDEAEGDLAAAVEELKVAQAANPTDTNLLVHLAGLQHQVGQMDDAAASYGEALRYIPDLEPALAALRAMKSGPADYQLARAAWQVGNKDEARRLMEQAAQESPRVAWLQVALGEFLAMIGDKDGARSAFQSALTIDPANEEAKAGLDSL